jgi:hypothetical protein
MLKTVAITSTGTLSYQGTWNASTNVPTLTSSVGVANQYYVVSNAGSTNLNGITNWQVGDWAIFNGSIWEKVDGGSYGAVTQVQGNGTVNGITLTGNVTTSGNLTLGGTLGNIANSQLSNSTATLGNATITLGSTTSTVGNLTLGNVTVVSGNIPSTVITGNVAVANEANNLVGGGNNYLVYQSSSNTTAFLAPGTSGYPLVAVASSPPAYTGTLNIPNGTFGNLSSANVNITGGTINVTSTNHTATTANTATFSTSALPLVPQGYINYDLNGTVVKIPYYAV